MIDALIEKLIENTVQCWGCIVFDDLFQIVSSAATVVYDLISKICAVIFGILFTVYVLNSMWQNIKGGMTDPFMKKSALKVFLSAVVALTLLGIGTTVPRFITTVIFEPVADVTLVFTQTIVQTTNEYVEETVSYEPDPMSDDGFYRPKLRDTVIMIMKTTVSQFQGFVELGAALMAETFSWQALLGPGAIVKHIFLFFFGFGLAWGFFKLFFRYCCYFADLIISMAMFAFFFPLSITTIAFKEAEWVPKWISELGKNVGTAQIKNLINSIVTLGSVVISYTIIMMIIANFFNASGTSINDLMRAISNGSILDMDLSTTNLENVTFFSLIALLYILSFVFDQIPEITKMILSAFGVSENKQYSEELANNITGLGQNWKGNVSKTSNIISTHGEGGKKPGADTSSGGKSGGADGGKAAS